MIERKIPRERSGRIGRGSSRGLAAIIPFLCLCGCAAAGDWTQWGGSVSRNMVAEERGLPESFQSGDWDPGGTASRLGAAETARWSVRVGSVSYSTPVVADGKVFVGACVEGRGALKCLDARDGGFLWQWVAPARDVPEILAGGRFCFFRHPRRLGLTSSPAVEGDRVFFVSHRCEVLCLDASGAPRGGDSSTAGDPASGHEANTSRVIWSYDMYEEVGTRPADACHSNVLIDGELLYVGTCNGVDRYAKAKDRGELRLPPAPRAPSLIALDKRTGRLVATDDTGIGSRVLHGQWSSPSLGAVGGRKLVFFGGGDGVCYAFEALAAVPEQPVKLKTVWTFDCNPPEYKQFGGMDPIEHFARGDRRRSDTINRDDGTFVGLNAFIASPVFHGGRVYVPIGQDPEHGRGRGALWCIDAGGAGDITSSGRRWCYQGLERSLSTVSIVDGLLYVADVAGCLHCLDAETGRCLWKHETGAAVWASTLVADGKVYLPTVKSLWVLAAGKEKKVLSEVGMSMAGWATPVAANGTLYLNTRNALWAFRVPPQISPADSRGP